MQASFSFKEIFENIFKILSAGKAEKYVGHLGVCLQNEQC